MEALAEECRCLETLTGFRIVCTKMCVDSEKVPGVGPMSKQVEDFTIKGERELSIVVLRTVGGITTFPDTA